MGFFFVGEHEDARKDPFSLMPESPIRAWFELLRLPNVFTAVADVAMGFLITHAAGASAGRWYEFALLAIASCGMYLAGMVLNDVFDVAVDTQERPQRPIPSGRISRSTAARFGWGLLAGGFAASAAAGVLSQDWRPPLVAAALAGCVVIYDRYAKLGPTGPIFMGGCRALNVLLGMGLATGSLAQASSGSWVVAHYLIAASIGIYIVGVTWFARTEARHHAPAWHCSAARSRRWPDSHCRCCSRTTRSSRTRARRGRCCGWP